MEQSVNLYSITVIYKTEKMTEPDTRTESIISNSAIAAIEHLTGQIKRELLDIEGYIPVTFEYDIDEIKILFEGIDWFEPVTIAGIFTGQNKIIQPGQ